MTQKLWTPFSKEMNAKREALTDKQTLEHIRKSKWLSRELREIDPMLDVVYIGEKAPAEFPDIIPGRWHICRKSSDGGHLDTYFPLVGPNGEYREPGAWLIDEFKARDLWNPKNMEDLMTRQHKMREDAMRKSQLDREGKVDNAAAAARAALRVPGEGGMTKRKWGAK